jgi:ATP-dependent DNA helicase 2 subunit 2
MVTPSATFKGALQLGTGLTINVKAFAKTMSQTPISAKKCSALVHINPNNPESGKINLIRKYMVSNQEQAAENNSNDEDNNNEEVAKDDLMYAYRYGKSLIPFSQDDEDACSIRTLKSMMIVSFISKSKIPRSSSVSNILAIVPDPDPVSVIRFNSLISALHDLENVAIVRYCRTDNAIPKMGVLYPHLEKGQAYFVHVFYYLI